jgi:hypothetical protein
VAQIYPRALGSLSVASYDSQVYSGGILSRLHTGTWQRKHRFQQSLYCCVRIRWCGNVLASRCPPTDVLPGSAMPFPQASCHIVNTGVRNRENYRDSYCWAQQKAGEHGITNISALWERLMYVLNAYGRGFSVHWKLDVRTELQSRNNHMGGEVFRGGWH